MAERNEVDTFLSEISKNNVILEGTLAAKVYRYIGDSLRDLDELTFIAVYLGLVEEDFKDILYNKDHGLTGKAILIFQRWERNSGKCPFLKVLCEGLVHCGRPDLAIDCVILSEDDGQSTKKRERSILVDTMTTSKPENRKLSSCTVSIEGQSTIQRERSLLANTPGKKSPDSTESREHRSCIGDNLNLGIDFVVLVRKIIKSWSEDCLESLKRIHLMNEMINEISAVLHQNSESFPIRDNQSILTNPIYHQMEQLIQIAADLNNSFGNDIKLLNNDKDNHIAVKKNFEYKVMQINQIEEWMIIHIPKYKKNRPRSESAINVRKMDEIKDTGCIIRCFSVPLRGEHVHNTSGSSPPKLASEHSSLDEVEWTSCIANSPTPNPILQAEEEVEEAKKTDMM